MSTYTVQPGDTLGIIARKLLGDSSFYKQFLVWNPEITDPNKIYVGQQIRWADPSKEISASPAVIENQSTGLKLPAASAEQVKTKLKVSPVMAAVGIGAALAVASVVAAKKSARARSRA